jgi:hypothetical protein
METPSIKTVGQLKAELGKYPDDMPLFVITERMDNVGTQHNLQAVKTYDPWHGDHKLLGLYIHATNKPIM